MVRVSRLLSLSLFAALVPVQATIIVQWNFNASNLTPNIGSGTASLVGGTTASFLNANVNGGSSDPTGGGDLGWNTTDYPAQGTNEDSAGVEFLFSTAGLSSVFFSFDVRPTDSASRRIRLQYTIDGSTWQNAPGAAFNLAQPSPQWNNQLTHDFSAVAGATNNTNFGVRIVTTFISGSPNYGSAGPGGIGNYSPTGSLRYDMITVSTPEPSTFLLGGLGLLALTRLRRAPR